MKDLVHVVVGAGSTRYFQNCLQSVTDNSDHDVLAFYNFIDENDRLAVQKVAPKFAGREISFEFQENAPNLRTGSLYQAYSKALDAAFGKYRYVSFTQADMQMMWWDDRIIDRCDQILEETRNRYPHQFCFYSQIPVRGKRDDYYSIWPGLEDGDTPVRPGLVDVGIYPLERFSPRVFDFVGTERDFSSKARAEGAVVALHPYPFLAPIPFPRTVRDLHVRSVDASEAQKEAPILRLTTDRDAWPNFDLNTFHPLYMENIVWPNGWSSFEPILALGHSRDRMVENSV